MVRVLGRIKEYQYDRDGQISITYKTLEQYYISTIFKVNGRTSITSISPLVVFSNVILMSQLVVNFSSFFIVFKRFSLKQIKTTLLESETPILIEIFNFDMSLKTLIDPISHEPFL